MLSLVFANVAHAQDCDASASGKAGDVTVEASAARTLVIWDVLRREGVGDEADNLARPSLALEFTMAADGTLSGPVGASVSISRISDAQVGRAPALSEITVRATPKGGAVLEWKANDRKGEAELAKRLGGSWPENLTIELVMAGSVAAGAEFILSKPALETLAREARAKCS